MSGGERMVGGALLRDLSDHLHAPTDNSMAWQLNHSRLAVRVDAELARPSVDYSEADVDAIVAGYRGDNMMAG
jgi:hypothetical protein